MILDYPEISNTDIEIIDGDRGKNYPKKEDFNSEGFCLFLNTGNIKNDKFDFSNCDFISENKDRLLRKGKLTRMDIILTTRGTVGNVAFYHDNILYDNIRLNSGMVILRCHNDYLPDYLYQVLKSVNVKKQFELFSSGAAQPQLPIKSLIHIKIPQIDIPSQNQIAEILKSYDDLIENNLRRIELLEKSAELLYNEWFVNLRFPGYENVEIKNGIPIDWGIKKILDIGEVITGKTPSTRQSENFGNDVLFVKTPDMHNNTFVLKTETMLSNKGANTQSKKMLPPFSIMISCIGSVGVVSVNPKKCQTNQQINSLIPFNLKSVWYLYFIFRDLKPRLEAIGGGATMNNVNKNKFETMDIIFPNKELYEKFYEYALPIFLQILNLQKQNLQLIKARDLLLPKLINGEIEV